MKQFIILSLLCLFFSTGCANNTFKNALEEGKMAVANEEYNKAEDMFALALEEKSNDEEAKALYDQVKKLKEVIRLKDEHKIDEAKKLCDEILNMKSESDVLRSKTIKLKDELKSLENYEKEKVEETKELANKSSNVKKDATVEAAKQSYRDRLQIIESEEDEAHSKYGGTDFSVADYREALADVYNRYDKILNEIYSDLKEQLPKDEMNTLRQIQRKWITKKEDEEQHITEVFGSPNTWKYVEINGTLAAMTRERCYELLEYLR